MVGKASRWLGLVVVGLWAVSPANAALLVPGGTLTGPFALGTAPSGSVKGSIASGYSFLSAGGFQSGTYQEVVYEDTSGGNPFGLGKYTLAVQLSVTSGDISAIALGSLKGIGVDVAVATPVAPFVAGTANPSSINRSADGTSVNWHFNANLAPGTTTLELLVHTDQTSIVPGTIGLIDGGGGTTVFGLTAVPEPASIVLLACGIAGMCGYGWKRRKVTA